MLFYFNKILSFKCILLDFYQNMFEVSKLKKIILHFGLKKAIFNNKQVIGACMVLSILSRQKGVICYSKKSVMFLKVRKGMIVGCKVTLQNYLKFRFLNKFIITLINFSKCKSYTSNSIFLNSFTMRFDELFLFKDLAIFFEYFDDLTFLNLSFISNYNSSFKTLQVFHQLQICEV
jgi:large subunit ribosomal protein L5